MIVRVFLWYSDIFLSYFARKLRKTGGGGGGSYRYTQKGWRVAQDSNEQQNSFLTNFALKLIPCSRKGAILLLNSKDLF